MEFNFAHFSDGREYFTLVEWASLQKVKAAKRKDKSKPDKRQGKILDGNVSLLLFTVVIASKCLGLSKECNFFSFVRLELVSLWC